MKRKNKVKLLVFMMGTMLFAHAFLYLCDARSADRQYEGPEGPPEVPDYDHDGLTNEMEEVLSLDPQDPDTDNDWMMDGEEYDYWTARQMDASSLHIHPWQLSLCPERYGDWVEREVGPAGDLDCDGIQNIADHDSDSDGNPDGMEVEDGTDPASVDSDMDGVLDWRDQRPGVRSDDDHDGMSDDWEIENLVTDPDGDDDMDGITNLVEFQSGSDPNVPYYLESGQYELGGGYLPLSGVEDRYDKEGLRRVMFEIKPITNPRYWRVNSYEIYDGYGWRQSYRPAGTYMGETNTSAIDEELYNNAEHYTVTSRGNIRGNIPTALHTTSVSREMPASVVLSKDSEGIYRTDIPITGYSYTAVLYNLSKGLRTADTETVSSIYLDLSRTPPSSSTKLMAQYIVQLSGAKTPFEKTVAILEFLNDNYQFNTSVLIPEDREANEYFLHKSKSGDSNSFATAFCILARMNDIPCRIATGYSPGITTSDTRIVMEGHQHTWAEIALKGLGWVGVETTPPNADTGHGLGLGNSGIDINVIQLPRDENNALIRLPLATRCLNSTYSVGMAYLGLASDWWYLQDRDPYLGGTGGGTTFKGYVPQDPEDNDLDGVLNELDQDDDNDGLTDEVEERIGSNPFSADTDSDGLTDFIEHLAPSSIFSGDTDGDGLSDMVEIFIHRSDPSNPDTDNDGSCDKQEVMAGSDPTDANDPEEKGINRDFDNDGTPDWRERDLGTDPTSPDSDLDGLTDIDEAVMGSNPIETDSDHDGLDDNFELRLGTDLTKADSDDDGVKDGFEVVIGTLPMEADSDMDGLDDGIELNDGRLDPLIHDMDLDGLSDGREVSLGLDPTDHDTDGDGRWDTFEHDIDIAIQGRMKRVKAPDVDLPDMPDLPKAPDLPETPKVKAPSMPRTRPWNIPFPDMPDLPDPPDLPEVHIPAKMRVLNVKTVVALDLSMMTMVTIAGSYFIHKEMVLEDMRRILEGAESKLDGKGTPEEVSMSVRESIFMVYIMLAGMLHRWGQHRRRYMTLREYQKAVMRSLPLDRDTFNALIGLVEEARYSTHLLGTDYRTRAFRCIRVLKKDLLPPIPERPARKHILRATWKRLPSARSLREAVARIVRHKDN